jgi:phosphoribosylformylglycinamidine synthase
MDFALEDFLKFSKVVMTDTTIDRKYTDLNYSKDKISTYLEQVLQLEAVACKDWLTNKVDRCVGGKVAKQQTTGPLQLLPE